MSQLAPAPPHRFLQSLQRCILALALAGTSFACAPVARGEAEWPAAAKQWFERAEASVNELDLEDAEQSASKALAADPGRSEIRMLAARVAMAQLKYDDVLKLLKTESSADAVRMRARAYWYSSRLELAADELETLLADPQAKDKWAEQAAKLARNSRGRTPFRMTGGLLAVSEMPRSGGSALIVPIELNGDPALAMIDTSRSELVIDAQGNNEPAWVSLRFGQTVEVKDVPAFKDDLSGISREVNAPIKALLGVNVLRHLNLTFDFRGSQFVVRSFEAPPPPEATTLKLTYFGGDGMAVRGRLNDSEVGSALLINTSLPYPLALDQGGWDKGGVDASTLQKVEGRPNLKHGVLHTLTIGAFEVPNVPGVLGASIQPFEERYHVDWDGALGAGLLAAFRITLADGGRTMWLEDMPDLGPRPTGEASPQAPAGEAPPAQQPGAQQPAAPPATPQPVTPAGSGTAPAPMPNQPSGQAPTAPKP